MPWLQYDLATGTVLASNNFIRLDDASLAAEGRGQIWADVPDPGSVMVDVNQTPPVVIPVPPAPAPIG